MSNRWDEALESANNKMDRLAAMNHPDRYPILEKDDSLIFKYFPYFVVVCLLLWLTSCLFTDVGNAAKVIELLCLSFTLCFAVLGFYCSLTLDDGILPNYLIVGLALLLTGVLWIFNFIIDTNYYSDAVNSILSFIGINLKNPVYSIIGFIATYAVLLFTSIGVTSVISTYLRKYIPNVMLSMNDHASKGIRSKSERFFMVPEIIDVEKVELEPTRSLHVFDLLGAVSLTTYVFIMGMLVSSYVFVNPYFLDIINWRMMLSITVMLTMFTPALIIPWQIFRSIGAKVISSAPRPYYLWVGAKYRLLTSFATMGAIMMMFMLSVYLGNNIIEIIGNYVAFIIPLLIMSIMYGILYANNFQKYDCEEICERYEEGLQKTERL